MNIGTGLTYRRDCRLCWPRTMFSHWPRTIFSRWPGTLFYCPFGCVRGGRTCHWNCSLCDAYAAHRFYATVSDNPHFRDTTQFTHSTSCQTDGSVAFSTSLLDTRISATVDVKAASNGGMRSCADVKTASDDGTRSCTSDTEGWSNIGVVSLTPCRSLRVGRDCWL